MGRKISRGGGGPQQREVNDAGDDKTSHGRHCVHDCGTLLLYNTVMVIQYGKTIFENSVDMIQEDFFFSFEF